MVRSRGIWRRYTEKEANSGRAEGSTRSSAWREMAKEEKGRDWI